MTLDKADIAQIRNITLKEAVGVVIIVVSSGIGFWGNTNSRLSVLEEKYKKAEEDRNRIEMKTDRLNDKIEKLSDKIDALSGQLYEINSSLKLKEDKR